MDVETRRQLDIIVQSIVDSVNCDAIYLFGSYAYGQPDENSDFDICVVVSDGVFDQREINRKIRYALRGKNTMPLDILIRNREVFRERSAGGTLENVIADDGVLLYNNGKLQFANGKLA